MKTEKYTNYKRQEIMTYEHPQIQKFIDRWGENYLSNIRQVSLNGNTRQKEILSCKRQYTSFSLTPADINIHLNLSCLPMKFGGYLGREVPLFSRSSISFYPNINKSRKTDI